MKHRILSIFVLLAAISVSAVAQKNSSSVDRHADTNPSKEKDNDKRRDEQQRANKDFDKNLVEREKRQDARDKEREKKEQDRRNNG